MALSLYIKWGLFRLNIVSPTDWILKIVTKKLTILLVPFILTLCVPLMAQAATIEGKVVEVQGNKVKIKYEGEFAPNAGDPCEIGFELGDDFAVVEGQWKIVEVGPDFAWAQVGGSGAGTPAPDYIVKISSPNPRERSALVKPEKKEQPEEQIPTPVKQSEAMDATMPKAVDITGAYALYREGDMNGRVLAKMRIANQRGNAFQVGNTRSTGNPARDWQGRGFINGAEGYYDWEFKDGKRGRTIFTFDADGNLHGQVRGTRINWDYVAQRKEGPVRISGTDWTPGASPYLDPETGIILWQNAAGLSKKDVKYFQDPRLGSVIEYNAPGIIGFVYIYNLGMKSMDDNPTSPAFKQHFQEVIQGIFNFEKSGHYKDVTLLSQKTIPFGSGKNCPHARSASLSYTQGQSRLLCKIYLLVYEQHFIKIRFNYSADAEVPLKETMAVFCDLIGKQLKCN